MAENCSLPSSHPSLHISTMELNTLYCNEYISCSVLCDSLRVPRGRDCVSFFPSPLSSQLPAWFFVDAQQIVIVLN